MLTAFQLVNIAEGFLWLVIGGIVVAWYRTRMSGLVAVVLVLFGISDWVEASTGAWWQPWWLLVWKATCVAILLAAVVRVIRNQRANQPDPQMSVEAKETQ